MSRAAFIVEADGGSRGNPGPAGYGALVRDAETGRVLAERAGLRRPGDQQRRRVRRAGRRAAGRARPRPDGRASRSGWTPSSSSSRCRAAGRSSTRTCSSSPLQARKHRPAARAPSATPGCRGRRTAPPTPWPTARWTASRCTGTSPPSPSSLEDDVAAGRRAGAASSPPSPTCCATGRPSTPRSVGSAAATTCRCRGPAGPRPRPRRPAPTDLGIDVVVASPLRRTRETAEIVAAVLGVPVELDDDLRRAGLRRPGGAHRRRGPREAPAGRPALRRRRRPWPAPGGESIADVSARVARARRRVLSRHAGRTVLVVSHVTPIKLLLAAGPGRRRRRRAPGVPGGGVAVDGRLVVGRPDLGAAGERHLAPALTRRARSRRLTLRS